MNSWESSPAQTVDVASFFNYFLNAYKVFDENPRILWGSIICASHVIHNQLQSHVYVVFCSLFILFFCIFFPLPLQLFTNHDLMMQVEEK
jgi:hypothetical protein